MDHVQTQILDRLTTLFSVLPTTGNRTYQASEHPLTLSSMPGLTYTIAGEGNGGGGLTETIKLPKLKIVIYIKGDDLEVSNQVLAEIEGVLYGDFSGGRYLDGLVTNLIYGGSSRDYITATALKHTRVDVEYKLEYQTKDGYADESI